jgi:hypothetical protein
MKTYAVYTLIDITATGEINNNTENQPARNQQRNWETAHQIVSLRQQVQIIAVPGDPKLVQMSAHDFGSYYRGQQQCWKFMFSADYAGIDPVTQLYQDFDNVPVITGLNETVSLPYSVFCSHGILKNLYIRQMD